jgi:hypothetical protein
MHLVQLLLPLAGPDGEPFDHALFEEVGRELADRFGGMTAYTRSPATGLWQEQPGTTARDEVVIFEVMVDTLNSDWWADYRRVLEGRFRQQELVVRAHMITRL